MSIEKLSDELINQIAAGEVIENPSAVIKELVENSIDAGATQIDIILENSGLKKITIKDNGCGISKEDLIKAPLRHATSKIKNFDDLYSIKSMGFRGEALASIFSIAKTTIETKTKKEEIGYKITSENTNEIQTCGCDNGTTIIVEDLFYNTPARKKYLKSSNLELKDIVEIVKRFQLIYNNKKINLKNNGSFLSNKPKFKTQKENLIYLLGSDLKEKIHFIEEEKDGIKVSGFIGNPTTLTYSFKKNQYLFVNNRFIKSKLINDAIYTGFGSNLMTQRHPFFILNIEIDPEIIDVNVHPTKIEVRFENELEIFEFVKYSVKNLFQTQELFKDFETQQTNKSLSQIIKEKQNQILNNSPKKFEESKFYENLNKAKQLLKEDLNEDLNNNQINENKKLEFNKNNSHKNYFSKETQKNFEIQQDQIIYEKKEQILNQHQKDNLEFTKGPLYYELEEYKILGQLNKMFIILETKNGMLLVDQHVASEKHLYELLLEEKKQEKPKIQMLLKPVVIHLENNEILLYKENKELLDKLGFDSEIFGNNEIIVRAVPISIRNTIVNSEKIKEYLHEILINKTIKCLEEEKHTKLASIACRSAIMAGEELSIPLMKRLVEQLRYLNQPFQCPHGRPTFLRYSYQELEKKFKRIV